MVNKFGQTRIAQYFQSIDKEERKTLESELVRKCLARNPEKSFMFQHLNYKVVYRRYASLYFIFGISKDEENEMGYYILIHRFVQLLDSYFGNVCELDIMMNLDKVYYILEEMIQNGDLIDGSEKAILGPLKDNSENYDQYKQNKKNTNPNIAKNLFHINPFEDDESQNFLPANSQSRPTSRENSYLHRPRKRSQRKTHNHQNKHKRAISQMDYYEIQKKILREEQSSLINSQIHQKNDLNESKLNIFNNDQTPQKSIENNSNEIKFSNIYKSLVIEPQVMQTSRSQQKNYKVYELNNEKEYQYKKPMKQRERSAKIKQSKINPVKYQDINELQNKYKQNLKILHNLKSQYKKSNKQPQKHRIILTELNQLKKQIEKTQIGTVLLIGQQKDFQKELTQIKNQMDDIQIQLEKLKDVEKTQDKKVLIDQYLQQQIIMQQNQQKMENDNWLKQQKEKLLEESEKYKKQQLKEIEISISLETPELIKWLKYLTNKKQLNFLITIKN